MEAYFISIFENVRYERALVLLLSLVEPDIIKQSKFTDNEVSIKKILLSRKYSVSEILKSILQGICQKTIF